MSVTNSRLWSRLEVWFRCFRVGTLSLEGESVAWLENFVGLGGLCARSQYQTLLLMEQRDLHPR